MQDTTGGQGQFFDQVKNYGYINGKQYTDVNQYKKDLGGNDAGVFDTGIDGKGGGGGGFTAAPTIDLQSIYDKAYADSGIKDSLAKYDTLGNQIIEKKTARDTAQAKINDNPFYSEATRVGRAAKLDSAYNNDAQTLTEQQKLIQNDIATKRADTQTKLQIATQQFNINSQQAQQEQARFNTLLQSGALDNASPADIASITKATGMSSNLIYSAINANKAKNVSTATIPYDDGTNQGFAIINTKTGQIISKQVVAGSKPTAADKKAAGGGGGTKTDQTSEVQYMVQLYQNTNANNPSWAKGHVLRQSYSPEDFKKQLLIDYPSAASYIKNIKL